MHISNAYKGSSMLHLPPLLNYVIWQFSQHFVLRRTSDTLVRKAVEVGRQFNIHLVTQILIWDNTFMTFCIMVVYNIW